MSTRGALRALSRRCPVLSVNRVSMALNKVLVPAAYCGLSVLGSRDENCSIPNRVLLDVYGGLGGGWNNVLRLKSCLDRQESVLRKVDDGLRKTHAVAPHRQSVRGSDIGLGEEVGAAKFVNGRGSPLGFLNHSMANKLVVAVDVDEVLGSFLSALNKFIADHYSANHSVSEFYVYEFFKIWNCSRAEADIRVHEFFKTVYFKKGIQPIPGAQRVLHRLSTFCNLSIVTSRQNIIKHHTMEWIEEHYPGLFQEIHFGNHFALDGKSRPKSEICRSLGAQVLIDDNPRYAIECAEVGINVLLFDFDNSYPWSKCATAASHPLVTKVHNWDEVERSIVSLMVS
uniref:Putative 5'(3')-deoxyribonucleotidase n=1 Tax=Anthurium amnicola TaxID=1678845 RepID=A0A1D1Z3X4_9ARAE